MFKTIRDERNLKAWKHNSITFILQNHNLHIINNGNLNFMVNDNETKFYAGGCSDLKNALLSLTDKNNTELLAIITA